MSEQADQPVAAEALVADAPAGVDATAPATNDDDIDTEAFDRMDAPDDDDAGAGDGQPGGDNDGDAPAAGADEIEFEADDGTKLKLPKAVEPALLRQKDYTQKTQAVAEQARALAAKESELAAQADQQAESLKTYRTEHITVHNYETGIAQIDTQLAEFAKVTPEQWAALRVEKPEDYDTARANRQLLRDTRADYEEALTAAKTDLATKETDLTTRQRDAQKADLAKAWQASSATLAKDIPDWSPKKGQEIADFAVKQFGFTPEELQNSPDPRAWKMAHENMTLRAENALLKTNQKQAKATETALKPQAVTPAVKPAGGGAKPTGVTDSLSDAEWFRRRGAQKARASK